MLNSIKKAVLEPLLTRIGTATTGVLVGMGANATHADWVGIGLTGAGLIAFDLLWAFIRVKAIESKAFDDVIAWLGQNDGK